jgi:hypothetical protein
MTQTDTRNPEPNPITTRVDELLLDISMALNERDSVSKGIKLIKALVELSPFTDAVDTVGNAASCAASGWARCQAQTYITKGLSGQDKLISMVVDAVAPDVYQRAASGEHGHGLPSVALALLTVVCCPLVRNEQLLEHPKPTPEVVGRHSVHQDLVKLVKRMAHQHHVDLAGLWEKASRIKANAMAELAADENDAFAYGRADEARAMLNMIETVNEFIEINSLNPYTRKVS